MDEFAGRHNIRNMDIADMMVALARGIVGRRGYHAFTRIYQSHLTYFEQIIDYILNDYIGILFRFF